jgi:hypothetical protein
VQPGDRRIHRIEMRRAIRLCQARKGRFPDDPPIDQIHEEKGRADNLLIVAHAIDVRHGKALFAKCTHHARLAVDGMCARQEPTRRLASQNESAARRRIDPVSRI